MKFHLGDTAVNREASQQCREELDQKVDAVIDDFQKLANEVQIISMRIDKLRRTIEKLKESVDN